MEAHHTIGLHVREDNPAAIHLYQSLGFITLETLPDYYEDGGSGLFMERISPPHPDRLTAHFITRF